MNRAERRQQQKKASKKTGRATSAPTGSPLTPQHAQNSHNSIVTALQYHNAGRLREAEGIYRQILEVDPDHPDALHLLGVTAHQMGNPGKAVELITRAIALRPDFADAHNNLGNALNALKETDAAIASYRRAVSIEPNYIEAHLNLGSIFQSLGCADEAVAHFRKTLAIRPNYAEAHIGLGNALISIGQTDAAIASYRQAVAIKPNFAEAHNNLGSALHEAGHADLAIVSYEKAVAIKSDFAEAYSNLGSAQADCGRLRDSFASHRRAVALNPDNDLFWAALAVPLESITFTSADSGLYADLLCLLDRPSVRPSYVARAILSALRIEPSFTRILSATDGEGEDAQKTLHGAATQLSKIPLLLKILRLCPIHDLEIERTFTALRQILLEKAVAGTASDKDLPFAAALALQCFTNEYVYLETTAETTAVDSLQRQIAALVEARHVVPPALLAALGAYRALYRFPWAEALNNRTWSSMVAHVIERQISEPLKERALRKRIPSLTAIDNQVSRSVREQYEENPYPRWIRPGMAVKDKTVAQVLRSSPLRFDLGDYVSPERPDILVAGCGTGQQALSTATRFSGARVLAVDLSLCSLSYALRKTEELGISNIEYAQADILELGALNRRFDLIGCTGVLHHLNDPMAGWQVLVDLLRPGGLMKVALYSEAARQGIVKGRALIDAEGYSTSAEDIRRCRQDVIARGNGGDPLMASICRIKDFSSLSECRDLLFHVQEHRFTLPQIKQALDVLKLKFLGFEMRDASVLHAFTTAHPGRDALTSLTYWHAFENDNPDTFIGMYQFWCQKT